MGQSKSATRAGGFTLIEMVTAMTLFLIVFGSMYVTMSGATAAFDTGQANSDLQEKGRRVLKQLIDELRGALIVDEEALGLPYSYPSVFERDTETSPFVPTPDAYDDGRGSRIASMSFSDDSLDGYNSDSSHPDRRIRNENRVSNELVILRLADRDVNGNPMLPYDPETGELSWRGYETSYLVVKEGEEYRLERWEVTEDDLGTPRMETTLIEKDVRKITFDALANDPANVRFNQLAITVYLEKRTGLGRVQEASIEGTVNLRNTRKF
ncbi:MAG: prepilin-type N-terminal cleavage/methylation domain-containing protein [Planctomycetota bacterium]